ncbi:MAG: hypothetical protein WC916_00590 [Candidatus Woesearchaeota archaeon]
MSWFSRKKEKVPTFEEILIALKTKTPTEHTGMEHAVYAIDLAYHDVYGKRDTTVLSDFFVTDDISSKDHTHRFVKLERSLQDSAQRADSYAQILAIEWWLSKSPQQRNTDIQCRAEYTIKNAVLHINNKSTSPYAEIVENYAKNICNINMLNFSAGIGPIILPDRSQEINVCENKLKSVIIDKFYLCENTAINGFKKLPPHSMIEFRLLLEAMLQTGEDFYRLFIKNSYEGDNPAFEYLKDIVEFQKSRFSDLRKAEEDFKQHTNASIKQFESNYRSYQNK